MSERPGLDLPAALTGTRIAALYDFLAVGFDAFVPPVIHSQLTGTAPAP